MAAASCQQIASLPAAWRNDLPASEQQQATAQRLLLFQTLKEHISSTNGKLKPLPACRSGLQASEQHQHTASREVKAALVAAVRTCFEEKVDGALALLQQQLEQQREEHGRAEAALQRQLDGTQAGL